MCAEITETEESALDIDWFCIDDRGEIAHFASGGRGFVPRSVKASREELNRAFCFVSHLVPTGTAIESDKLLSHVSTTSSMPYMDKDWYISSFRRMSEKGLYSFDCSGEQIIPTGYFLVTRPSLPLSLSMIPDDVRRILEGVRYTGLFSGTDTISSTQIL